MALTAGTRIGPYEIAALIGEGGMGQVYRARDTRLNRDIALKVLPEMFALDADRLARFKREAQVLASLNHPNIAAIYGFEEQSDAASGVSRHVHALALELVEGPTLADRIAKGPIPLDEALPIARQIADALEAAHEQGIVHRDLKPANIKIRPDGAVKVLDFGLAKAMNGDAALAGASAAAGSMSPTITSPAATRIGMILGTAAYMSPEQARGKTVDKRTDIWAFGCVLYEMLTGTRAFGGEDVTHTLAFIVMKEPDWTALPAGTPTSVRRLVRRCLQKDRRQRLADIADARLDIQEQDDIANETAIAASASPSHRTRWWIAACATAGSRPYDFMKLAPDGHRLAVTLYEGQQDVFIYDLVRGDFDRITFDPHNDFSARWSPDGRNVVFSSVRRGQIDLYSVPADKSSPAELLYASDYPKWPSSWSPDGKLLAFQEQRPGTGMDIWLYSMAEGKARPFGGAPFNEWSPQFSSDGRWLAFASDELGRFEIYVVPYPGPGPTCKVSTSGGSEPHWSEDGKELFYRQGTTAMVVAVANRNFCSPVPRALFDGLDASTADSWDVSPKGDFFVTLDRREPPQLHLVLNWFDELKRLVPTPR